MSSARGGESLTVAGLFAGIGGIELGLHQAGHRTRLLCEIDPGASFVLGRRFPDVSLTRNVCDIDRLPRVQVVAGGFPCQDLSQAGRTAGIKGKQSSLVGRVFRLLDAFDGGPRWLLLENVSFMLHLDRGRAMHYLIEELEARRFAWAYRVVDTMAFGLPQRRQRVILLASRKEEPWNALFADDAGAALPTFSPEHLCGFYWTEGIRGLGWAVDAVPTLKGGSTVGIPSPPAIWDPRTDFVGTPDIRDAERLQGFEADWTLPALEAEGVRRGHRWKLIGNAVSVPVARWVGQCIARPGVMDPARSRPAGRGSWPKAAWGHKGSVYRVDVSLWPVRWERPHLVDFLRYPLVPLSERATSGFLERTERSNLAFPDRFLDGVTRHRHHVAKTTAA